MTDATRCCRCCCAASSAVVGCVCRLRLLARRRPPAAGLPFPFPSSASSRIAQDKQDYTRCQFPRSHTTRKCLRSCLTQQTSTPSFQTPQNRPPQGLGAAAEADAASNSLTPAPSQGWNKQGSKSLGAWRYTCVGVTQQRILCSSVKGVPCLLVVDDQRRQQRKQQRARGGDHGKYSSGWTVPSLSCASSLICGPNPTTPTPTHKASLLSGLVGPGAKVNIKLHGYDDRRKKEVSSGRGTTHLLPIYEAHEVGGLCVMNV